MNIDKTTQQMMNGIMAGDNDVVRQCLFVDCRRGFRHLSARYWSVFHYTEDEICSLAYEHLREYDWSVLCAYDGRKTLTSYIITMTARMLAKRRKEQLNLQGREFPLDNRQTDIEASLETCSSSKTEQTRLLFELLDTLPDRERRVLVYFKLYGYSAQEVAELMNTTQDNVYNLSKRAIQKLQKKVQHEY